MPTTITSAATMAAMYDSAAATATHANTYSTWGQRWGVIAAHEAKIAAEQAAQDEYAADLARRFFS